MTIGQSGGNQPQKWGEPTAKVGGFYRKSGGKQPQNFFLGPKNVENKGFFRGPFL